jgi:hypothetical protein
MKTACKSDIFMLTFFEDAITGTVLRKIVNVIHIY